MLLKELERLNPRGVSEYGASLNETDLKIANENIRLYARKPEELKVGDIVELTDEYGSYYPRALVAEMEDDEVHLCEHAYIPFTSHNPNYISVSGGAFQWYKKSELVYKGRTETLFCDWGHCGGCANGAINFPIEVNLWECKADVKFSTKDFTRYYISDRGEKENAEDEYRYSSWNPTIAWTNNEELSAFCILNKAFIEKEQIGRNPCKVWTWKVKEQYWLEDSEVLAMEGVHDFETMNGRVRNVCYVYHEDTKTINKYFGKEEFSWEFVRQKYKSYFDMSHEKTKQYVRDNGIKFPESFII